MKDFFVLGLGRSGCATARFLQENGHAVTVFDDDPTKRMQAEQEGMHVGVPTDWSTIDAFVLSPGIAHTHAIVTQAKEAGCQPMSDIALFFRFFPGVRAVGITGTNGKSTTCALLRHILEAQGMPCVLAGNFGIPIFSVIEPEKTYILELSSYQLDISPALPLFVGAILHIVPHHLDRYVGVEDYIHSKLTIFSGATHKLLGKDRGIDLSPYLKRTKVTEVHSKDLETTAALMPHDRENAAMAQAIARLLGVYEDTLLSFRGLAHRQEYVGCFEGIHYINDSKATSPEAAFEALRNLPAGQVMWIAGGVVQADDLSVFLPILHRLSMVFLIGQATERFADFLDAHNVPYVRSLTLTTALEHATQEAARSTPATIVLSPACASFDQFRDFEQRGEIFCAWVHTYWQAHRVLG